MQANTGDRFTLIDELDTQQNALLDQLDALNLRIESVLAALAPATDQVPAQAPQLQPKAA